MGGIHTTQETNPAKSACKCRSSSKPVKKGQTGGSTDLDKPLEEPSPNNSATGNDSLSTGSNTDFVAKIAELTQIISTLCDKISSLEAVVQELKDSQATKPAPPSEANIKEVSGSTSSIQPEPKTTRPTYANAVKQTATHLPKKTMANTFNKKQLGLSKKTINKSIQEEKERKTNDVKEKQHVKRPSYVSSSLSRSRPMHQEHSKVETSNYHDLPVALLVHDSILNGIQESRLGRSYGMKIFKHKAHTVEEIDDAVKSTCARMSRPPDAILIHCGINDLKTRGTETTCHSLLKKARKISHDYPGTKVVISKIAATRDQKLQIKRDLYNAILTAELQAESDIVSHDNLRSSQEFVRIDRIHPTPRETGLLAGNIGRHLRGLFWKSPRRSAKSRHRNFPANSQRPPVYYNHRHFTLNQDPWWNPYELLYNFN